MERQRIDEVASTIARRIEREILMGEAAKATAAVISVAPLFLPSRISLPA